MCVVYFSVCGQIGSEQREEVGLRTPVGGASPHRHTALCECFFPFFVIAAESSDLSIDLLIYIYIYIYINIHIYIYIWEHSPLIFLCYIFTTGGGSWLGGGAEVKGQMNN